MPVKPSDKEEEYFVRLEIERRRKLAEERENALAKKKHEEMKKLHWMHCPKCGSQLEMIMFKGIEIDRCFSCNGTWLDEGEVEKLVQSESSKSVVSTLFRVFK